MNLPKDLIRVKIEKGYLVLTVGEYIRGLRRGKWWRRREALEKRTAKSAEPSGGVDPKTPSA